MDRGLPRPLIKWKKKLLPLPYSAKENAVKRIHAGRIDECEIDGLCIVCGDPLDPDFTWYFDRCGEALDGGMHERCSKITAVHCPKAKEHLKSANWKIMVTDTQSFLNLFQYHWDSSRAQLSKKSGAQEVVIKRK